MEISMEVRTYTERSNARRAAKVAGVDPTLVFETEDGFTFPPPELQEALAVESPPADDAIPSFCKIQQDERAAAWAANPPKLVVVKQEEAMAPSKKAKPKTARESGAAKTALLLDMLSGNGATVEALTKATGWLPHTLRARISGVAKPKSKGGEGIKIERERRDGITTYRAAG
jgi:hypothetical protein